MNQNKEFIECYGQEEFDDFFDYIAGTTGYNYEENEKYKPVHNENFNVS